MKATIEVPDELYRRVKAKTALQGRAIREVTVELYEKWVDEPMPAAANEAEKNERWLEEFLAIGREVMRDAPPGPTAREILEEGRNRLESKEG